MTFDFETTAAKQAEHAHDAYMITDSAHPVKADHDARVARAAAAKTTLTNAQLGTTLPALQSAARPGVPGVSYAGNHEITTAANRAGVDAYPEDTQGVEDLEHEVLVDDAADGGDLYTTGGPLDGTSYTGTASLSPYVDSTWLAERSKQTGEKYF